MTATGAETTLPPIDSDRLWQTLQEAAHIGAWREPGVQRLALSDADKQMRDTFRAWCEASGFRVRVDQIGNIFVRRSGDSDGRPVMIGSHLDTQVAGGRYDGVLGVLAGLEVLRTLDASAVVTEHPIELVVWANEEGARFSPSMFGSSVYVGAMPISTALATLDDAGIAYGAELQRIGYDGKEPVPGQPPLAYFELHIEQSDFLYNEGLELGIVTSAFPARGVAITLRGETAHAGATPMRKRRDALVGAAEVITAIDRLAIATGDEARATTTKLAVWPGCGGIVPSEVRLVVDFRYVETDGFSRLADALEREVERVGSERELEVEIEKLWEFGSEVQFDPELAAIARSAADALGVAASEMPSVAGHDAYLIAGVAPTQILFVPCVEGISHNVREDIEFDRVLGGVNVLAISAVNAANRECSQTTTTDAVRRNR